MSDSYARKSKTTDTTQGYQEPADNNMSTLSSEETSPVYKKDNKSKSNTDFSPEKDLVKKVIKEEEKNEKNDTMSNPTTAKDDNSNAVSVIPQTNYQTQITSISTGDQAQLVAQILPPTNPIAISLSPNTLPIVAASFGASDELYMKDLIGKKDRNEPEPLLRLTTTVMHLSRLFFASGSGSPTLLPSRVSDAIFQQYLEPMAVVVRQGFKEAMFGWDSNAVSGKFLVNPYSEQLVDIDGVSDISAKTSQLTYMTYDTSNNYAFDQQMSIKLFDVVLRLCSVAKTIGAFRYIASKKDLTGYSINPTEKFGSEARIRQVTPSNQVIIVGEKEELYDVRIAVPAVVEDLALLKGNLPHDDFTRWFPTPFLSSVMVNERHRSFVRLERDSQLEFGAQSNDVVALAGNKVMESAILPTDVRLAVLNSIYLNYLKEHIIDSQALIEFLEYIYPRRDHYDDYVTQYRFYAPRSVSTTILEEVVDLSYLVCDEQSKHAFTLAMLVHPSLLQDTYQKIYAAASRMLTNFPFLTLEASIRGLTSPSTLQQFPGLNPVISTLNMSTMPDTPEQVAMKMVLSLMAQYVNIPATISIFDINRNPQLFVQDLVGLLIGNMMYPHLHRRNKVARMQTIHDFLLSYFRLEYSVIFAANGFGTDINGLIVTNIIGLDRTNCPVVRWTIDHPGNNFDPLLADVMKLLSLNNILTSIQRIIPANKYRVRGRTVLLPCSPIGPQLGTAAVLHEPATIIITAIDDLGSKYYNKIRASNLTGNKIQVAAYNMYVSTITTAAESFALWFQIIYASVYQTMAMNPLLIDDDITTDYSESLAFRDSIKEDDPTFNLAAPLTTPRLAQLPGVPTTLFGSRGAKMAFGLYLVASAPGSYVQGTMINQDPKLNLAVYAPLYSPDATHPLVEYYFMELRRRHEALEMLELVEQLSRGDMLRDVTPLYDCFQSTIRLAALPAAAVAAIIYAIGFKGDMDNDRLLRKQYDTSIYGFMLSDPRVRHLTKTYMTYAAPAGIARTQPYVSVIRPYVRTTILKLVNWLFGDGGIRPIIKGFSLSKAGLLHVDYSSIHSMPTVLLTINPDKIVNSLMDGNMYTGYVVKMRTNNVETTYVVQSAPELFYKLKRDNIRIGYPHYKVAIVAPSQMTMTQAEFLAEAINQQHGILTFPNHYMLCYYGLATSMEADQGPYTVTPAEVHKMITKPHAALTTTQLVNTTYETNTQIITSVGRDILPIHTFDPRVVARGFHTNVVTGTTRVQRQMMLTPAPTAFSDPPAILVNGVVRDAERYAIDAQLSYHHVFTVNPRIATFLVDSPV